MGLPFLVPPKSWRPAQNGSVMCKAACRPTRKTTSAASRPKKKKNGVCTVLHVSARRHTAQHKPGGEPPETNRHAPNIFDTDTAERNGMPEATSRPNTAHLNGMHDKPRRQAARRTSSVRRDVVFFTQPSPGRVPARASLDDGQCALFAPEPSRSSPERLRTSQLQERHPVRLCMFFVFPQTCRTLCGHCRIGSSQVGNAQGFFTRILFELMDAGPFAK